MTQKLGTKSVRTASFGLALSAVLSLLALSLLMTCGMVQPAVADETQGDKAAESKPAADKPTPAKTPKRASDTLDDELLKGLGDDPLEGLDTKPKPPTKPAAGASGKPEKEKPEPNKLDDELLKGLEGGDDARASGEAENGDPLVRLNRLMRESEELLRARKSGQRTQQLQEKIVRNLEQLIELSQQQQQSSSSSSSKQQQPKPGAEREKVAQPKQTSSTSSKPSSKPARDSTARVGKANAERPDPGKIEDLLKDVWGELPPRLRQQMLQSSIEKFVPKYELLIEEYFKTLAERPQDAK